MITFLVRTAITNYHRPAGLNNRNLFLVVLEAGKSKITVPAWSGSGDSSPPALLSSPYDFTWWGEGGGKRERGRSLMSLLTRALIPS